MKRKNIILLGLFLQSSLLVAQEKTPVPNVHPSDIMYQKTITRGLDLREKQNLPLFSRNREITALMIDGVLKGTVKAYENDSLENLLTIDAFSKKLLSPAAASIPEDTTEIYIEYGPEWRKIIEAMQNEKYLARDLYQLEIKEQVLFDKQRSRMYYDIQTITVFIPADHPMNEKGIQIPLASFRYQDLKENLFTDNPKAIWYNTQNDREHKNLADAFELRLFSSYIIKVSNANDAYLTDIYKDQQKGIMAATWAAHELMEYEP